MTTALRISALSKTFAGQAALTGVDLTVQAGEVRALLGVNGSGKSTLIKVLSGFHEPDPGAVIDIAGQHLRFGSPESAHSLGIRFVHQDLGLIPSMSVLDNLAFTAGYPVRWGTVQSRQARRVASAALAQVGVDLDPRTPVAALPPATRTAVALARALIPDQRSPVRLLVLDEPTASLTGESVDILLETVARLVHDGVAVLYVTHRLDEVFTIADSVSVLRDGVMVPTPAVAELDRASLVTLLLGEELQALEEEVSHPPTSAHGDPVLDVRDLEAGQVRDVALQVRAGEVVGVAGVDGSGREDLLSAVFGGRARSAGIVEVHGQRLAPERPDAAVAAGVAYLPADRRARGGFMDLPASENISISDLMPFWRGGRLRRKGEHALAQEWFQQLQVSPRTATERKLAQFSGGNQQKILMAKWLRRRPTLLLLEEATQGVDVAAKLEIHRAVLKAAQDGAAVLVSSSDVDELAALCHRVLVLNRGCVTRELTGSAVSASAITRELLSSGALPA